MAEIAIALGVIAFALVAIIGILPRGLQVQRDNRSETIINQDATFWLEAIRGGAQGVEELTNYVESIEIVDRALGTREAVTYQSGQEIVEWLTLPAISNREVHAVVMAMSGSAAEKEIQVQDRAVSFKYRLEVSMSDRLSTGITNSYSFRETTMLRDSLIEPLERDPLVTLVNVRLKLAYPMPQPTRSISIHTLLSPTITNQPGQIPILLQP